MTKQDDFVNQPLQKKLNRQNILSRLERVEQQSGIRPSARVGQLSDLTQAVGNLIVTGGITVVDSATGTPLLFISADGIKIVNINSAGDPYLNFHNPNDTKLGSIRTSSLENLEITAFGYAVEAAHRKLVLRAQHDGGAVNVATIEIISNFNNTGVDWITLNADKINLAGDVLVDGEEYASRSNIIFHDQCIASTALTKTAPTAQRYQTWAFQAAPADGQTFDYGVFLQAGTYTCTVLGETDPNAGRLDWTLDAVSQTTAQDWYSAGATNNVEKSFTLTVTTSGYHRLRGTINGKNASSGNYFFTQTAIYITPSAY